MRIKNTLEDLVYNLTDSIISTYKDEIPKTSKFKLDVVCYVLNRILPEYIISYRGLIYEELELKSDSQKFTDIISLIYDAIRTIKNRRKDDFDDNISEEIEWGYTSIESNDYYFNFPQIIGQVLSSSNFEPIDQAEVLLVDEYNKKIDMASPLWKNPVQTFIKTNGIFTFWPKSIKSENNNAPSEKNFRMKIIVTKKEYLKEEKFFSFNLKSEKVIVNQIRRGDIINLEPVYLVK